LRTRTELGTFAPRLATCHPDKRHKGNGLCVSCYSRDRARQNATANRERSRSWYANNTDKAKSASAAWNAAHPDGHRRNVIRSRYGISADDERQILERQNYLCPICGGQFDASSRATVAHIDHDHSTGKVRGILHFRCNVGIGALGDSAERLANAIAYLSEGAR